MQRRKPAVKISDQIKDKIKKSSEIGSRRKQFDGNTETMISTGSTLLDLAISGGRIRGGGVPGGIFVEIFGPAGSGKTVLLCEIAGGVKRAGGEVMFNDPEARLNKKFAKLFDLDVDKIEYGIPITVPEVFKPIRSWKPKNDKKINGIFADSLAALSTDMELNDKDQYGMRRAKEFSEELRKTCRTLTQKNYLMVTSNQLRENVGAVQFSPKYKSPGGHAIEFYSSLRLKVNILGKITKKKTVVGKEVKRIVGVTCEIEVFKSSVWEPYRKAPLTIIFDYGIDSIRDELQFVKDYTQASIYSVGDSLLDKSMENSIVLVEENNLERKLRNQVIDLWEEIEAKFKVERKPKRR